MLSGELLNSLAVTFCQGVRFVCRNMYNKISVSNLFYI